MAIKQKFLKRPTGLIQVRDKSGGAATTITVAAAAGATTITVASATGITAGKSLRVGTDEDIERVEVASVASLVVTLVKPLVRAHASGEPVVEQSLYSIRGLKGGIKTNHAQESTDEFSSTQRLVWTKLQGFETFGVEVTMEGLTLPNLCFALGIPLSRIFGSGADVDNPMRLATDLNDTDSEQNVCIIATYVLQDGTVMVEEFWGCAADYSALSLQLAIGQAGAIPARFVCYGAGVQRIGAITATALTTYQASKAKTFGKLTGVGLWAATGTPTTVGTAAAADAATLIVADASGLAAGDWIGLGSGDTFETHWIESISTNTLTLKSNLLRAQAVGVAVTKLAQVSFASVTRDGATFAIGGQSNPIYVGTRAMAIGTQAESAEASITMRLQELTLAARAYLLGIPQSAISSNTLLVTENLNTAGILGVYALGVLQDGTVNYLNLWGPTQDLADVGAELASGANSSRQFKAVPTSGLQFVQYAA
jgi:hypothetical protein